MFNIVMTYRSGKLLWCARLFIWPMLASEYEKTTNQMTNVKEHNEKREEEKDEIKKDIEREKKREREREREKEREREREKGKGPVLQRVAMI
jgi:hypothetical protein